RIFGLPAIEPETLRPDEIDPRLHRLQFRLPPPRATLSGELLWRQRLLATVPLVVQSPAEYLQSLSLTHVSAQVKLAGQAVQAQAFPASQCQSLTATALVRSPTTLVPLAALGVQVQFQSGTDEETVELFLSPAQLFNSEAILLAQPTRPRTCGRQMIRWSLGHIPRAAIALRAMPLPEFQQTIQVADLRYAVRRTPEDAVQITRQLPPQFSEAGPCFLVRSTEAGAAGRITLRIAGLGKADPPYAETTTLFVCDAPSIITPGLLPFAAWTGLTGFELFQGRQRLARFSRTPVPQASFNAEGGFVAAAEFTWTSAAEEELSDRLKKLLEG
ncbi:MAG: hypothetical protein ACRCZF_11500, partial [Gemmataceae bacterium]